MNERNAAIKAARDRGMTYRAIGLEFGLSHERIRQILAELERLEHNPLSTRCYTILGSAGLTEHDVDAIRERGQLWWLRVPKCGTHTVAELGRLVGGWPDA